VHAAKILECGAAAVTNRFTPDGMLCTMRQDEFVIEPANPQMKCTPVSVAAHTLYENADPFLLYEPKRRARDRQGDLRGGRRRCVRRARQRLPQDALHDQARGREDDRLPVDRHRRRARPGDPRQLDAWISSMQKRITDRIDSIFGQDMKSQYHMNLRVYGATA